LHRLLVEPARPRAVSSRPGAYRLAVATVCLGAFMGQLDASIVSVAFPTISRDLHATLGDVQWVGFSYLLVLVALVPAIGGIADVVGRKLLYGHGFVVFVAGSALCGVAPSLPALDGFRALQALGAGMLQANSVAIIALAVPRERLVHALGVQGAAQALGLCLGPAFGGLLISLGGWRWIFLVNVPVGLAGAVATRYLVPRSRDLRPGARFDWPGLLLCVPAIGGLLLALSEGNERGWSSPPVLASFAAAAVLGALFLLRERRAPEPMIALSLFARRAFARGIASGLLAYLVLFGALFVAPFFLERARGLSPAATGAMITSMPIGLGLAASFGSRFGGRRIAEAGLLATTAGLVLLALAHGSLVLVAAELALVGAGLGLFTPANNAAVMSATPRNRAGSASGILNMTRGLGTALGLATTGAILTAVAGARPRPHLVANGFTAAILALAAVAAAAALVARAEAA
jgi:EmrB/QacA subfamily drug resistance transporter